MAATAPPAARMVRAQMQNRLMVARCAFAAAFPTASCLPDDWGGPFEPTAGVRQHSHGRNPGSGKPRGILLLPSCGRFNSKDVKIAQPAFDRLPHSGDEGGYSPAGTLRKPQHRYEVHGKRITLVFQVELDPTGRIDRCASSRLAVPSCKRNRGVSSRKIPPICPLTSRATQKPSLLRPMKNAGIASLTIAGSSG